MLKMLNIYKYNIFYMDPYSLCTYEMYRTILLLLLKYSALLKLWIIKFFLFIYYIRIDCCLYITYAFLCLQLVIE